jgi:hypothetical protein
LAAKNLTSVLKQGGQLLIVVPIGGRPHIKFNANRVYTYSQVLGMFDELKLVSNALITDYGKDIHFIENATEDQFDDQKHGCGCFYFKKY